MNRKLLLPLIMIFLATTACSLSLDLPKIESKAGPEETFTVNVPAPTSGSSASLEISMGAGKLTIAPTSSGLVTGTVRYNIADWKPEVSQVGSKTTISQSHSESLPINVDSINEWNLALNPALTYDLDINAGAYEGNLDLSGIGLTSLQIDDGASKASVTFSKLNPASMDLFAYKTGASEVSLHGLANANFSRMTFDCGAGSYTLDFSGALQRDASVQINGGVSQITIIVPAGMNAVMETDGALNNVDASGEWNGSGSHYQTGGSGSTLTIKVDMGVGNLVLKTG